jgi:hypothetical protein
MAALIAFVRKQIADPTGDTAHFTDDDIQAALDARRKLVKFELLEVIPTPTASGYQYLDYQSAPFFENDAVLADGNYAAITPTSSSMVYGIYAFSDSQSINLYITGKRYDLYAAAAELCHEWIASLKNTVDFNADGSSFKMSQQLDNLQALAARFEALAEGIGAGTNTSSVYMERGDVML